MLPGAPLISRWGVHGPFDGKEQTAGLKRYLERPDRRLWDQFLLFVQ
jgi:hypothetical protein